MAILAVIMDGWLFEKEVPECITILHHASINNLVRYSYWLIVLSGKSPLFIKWDRNWGWIQIMGSEIGLLFG